MKFSKRNQKVAINHWTKTLKLQRKNIPNNKNALVNKAALCGFLAGDGYVKKRREKQHFHYEVKFFPDNNLMLETYCKYLKIL